MTTGENYLITISDFKQAVKLAEWGTYGEDGKQPLKYVRLIDCSTEHLKKILLQIGVERSIRQIIAHILNERK
tara:strand:+ start:16575 stop:16793 length:219 start_codon:yes stop_codon:yes gene_type:complete